MTKTKKGEDQYYSYKLADPSQLDEVWKYYEKFN